MANENGETFTIVTDEEPLETSEDLAAETASTKPLLTRSTDQKIIHIREDFTRGKLHIQPDFQRHLVWDASKCSRLIESIFLKVPLPVIYLAETDGLKLEVIDGQQRLATVLAFLNGGPLALEGTQWDGKLRGLKAMAELNGKTFSDLDDKQKDLVQETELRVITIQRDSDPDVKFEVFRRLNTGAVMLNEMELRNCVYRGPFNELLKKESLNSTYRKLLGNKAAESRMKDVELVLRFVALYEIGASKYTGRMTRDLTKFMEINQNAHPKKLAEWSKVWAEHLEMTVSILGLNAFRRYVLGEEGKPDGRWETNKLNFSLFDAVMQSWQGYNRNQLAPYADAIADLWIEIQTSPEFEVTLAKATDNKKNVETRIKIWRAALEQLVGMPAEKVRMFNKQTKNELFQKSAACKICQQQIHEIDDAEVDHIIAWIKGGETKPANAQLAHRFCNRSKGAK